jgi:FkbM family methyltransferase
MDIGSFVYNSVEYNYLKTSDPSTQGCIREIVDNDEYLLRNWYGIENSAFIDIGANCGIATIIMAKQNPGSTIYSFEPDRRVFEYLKQNVSLNKLENVKLFNNAVCRKGVKTVELCIYPHYSGGNTTCSGVDVLGAITHSDVKSYPVDCVSLSDIIESNSISSVELLKIDCEGAEYEILYESDELKHGFIKNLVGEFHNLPHNSKINNVEHNGSSLLSFCEQYINGIVKVFILNLFN